MGLGNQPHKKVTFTISKYSHGVMITPHDRRALDHILSFLDVYELKEPKRLPNRKIEMELKKRFYGITRSKKYTYIHRNTLPSLLGYLKDKGYQERDFKFADIPIPVAADINLTVKEKFIPRDYQEVIIECICDDTYSTRIDLQTGRGKTLTSLIGITRIGKRTLIMIPPKYFGLWTEALEDIFDNIQGRYVTVSGSGELQVIIHRALEDDLDYDIIIMSMVTYRNYIEYFEQFGQTISETPYLIPPCRFHEVLKIGVQINDEIQEDPGLVFRIDVFTNVAKQIYLSATPYTGSEFVTKMIDHMLPDETKVPLPELDVYANVIAVLYDEPGIQPKDYLVPFKRTFNHARYEKMMLRKPNRLNRYYDKVKRLVTGLYVKDRVPGQKLLILCATVNFIEKLTKELQQEYKNLKITSYVSGSDYNKMLNSDIIVSTIKSSGTGVDIPNLREELVLQFTDSKKDNIQILGRLRRLKDFPDVTPRMTYLVCTNIPASMKYHANKKQYFGGRVLNHRVARV